MLLGNRMNARALVLVLLGLVLLSALSSGPIWAQGPTGTTVGGLPGDGGGPSLAPPSAPCIVGASGAVCFSPPGDLTATFPAGSGPIGSLVTISSSTLLPIPVTGAKMAVASTTYSMIGHTWQLNVTSPNGTPVTGALSPALDIAIKFTAADLAAAGGNAANLVIMVMEPASGIWTPLTITSVDTVTGVIHVSLTNLPADAVFGLFAKS
jgi:hypothetical protein